MTAKIDSIKITTADHEATILYSGSVSWEWKQIEGCQKNTIQRVSKTKKADET